MIKTLLHPVFLFCVLLAAINQLLEYNGIFVPFIHSYLDDVLAFPIVLTVGLAFYRIVWKNYTLTLWHIWPLLMIYVFIFEIYLPTTSPLYTADVFDVLAYILGILLFQRVINKPLQSLQPI